MPANPNPTIFGAGQTGRSLAICAQSWVNAYSEVKPDPAKKDRGERIFFARWGLGFYNYYGGLPLRGWLEVPPYLYFVAGATLYQVAANGVATPVPGALPSAQGPVFMDTDGVQLGFSDTQGNFTVYQITGTSVATGLVAGQMESFEAGALGFLGSDFFTYLDNAGVVVVPGTGITLRQMQQANVTDFTGWNALAFDYADSKGDTLIAVKGYKGILYAFGTIHTEFWQNLGLGIFQFGRTPTAVQATGLAAAGSIVEWGESGLALLAQMQPSGQVVPTILTPNGYPPDDQNPLADPDMVATINARIPLGQPGGGALVYGTLSDAVGSVFMQDQHRFYLLSFPTAGKTWLWDAMTQHWSQLSSDTGVVAGAAINTPAVGIPTGVQGMFRGLRAITFGGALLFSDFATGHVYQGLPTGTQDSDLGCPFPFQLVGMHLQNQNRMLSLPFVQLDMQEGVGNAACPNPRAMLEISRDKGNTYTTAKTAAIGQQGAYRNRVIFRALGSSRDLVPRLTITDPVKRVLTGEVIELEDLAA